MLNILITGASRGIGLEMARQYGADGGWRVQAACRRPEAAADLERIASASEGRVTVHRLDVTDASQIRGLAGRLRDEPIDVLMNNAGGYGQQHVALGSVDEPAWIELLRVNAIAPLKMAEAFLPQVERSRLKVIAAISSKMGSIGDNSSGGYYPYRSSKAALNMVMKSLAVDLKERGIICVALSPGWVRTDMGGPRAPLSPEQSVHGMRTVLAAVSLTDSGKFLGWDGEEITW